jgi:predicted dehydrogenase
VVTGWAVVGCGWLARDHLAPALGGALVAACDPHLERARALGAPLATDDLDALLAHPEVRHVHVATPNDAHAEVVRACAAAGRHVLCEKPMATSLADAEAMVAACAEAGVRYATAHNQRFHPAHVALAELVAAGALGTVTQGRVHYACRPPAWWGPADWHFDPARAGGGAVFDLAPHGLDLLAALTQTRIAEVTALRQRALLEHPVEDGGVVVARYGPGDLLGVVQVAYTCPEAFPRRRLELVGTRAMAIATDTMGQDPGGEVVLIDAADGRRERVAFDTATSPFRAQAEAFVAGRTPPPERDLDVMAALEQAMGSAV